MKPGMRAFTALGAGTSLSRKMMKTKKQPRTTIKQLMRKSKTFPRVEGREGSQRPSLPVLARPQTFAEEFAAGPPQRTAEQHGQRLNRTESRYILWRWKADDQTKRIAKDIGVHRSTVFRRILLMMWETWLALPVLFAHVPSQQHPPTHGSTFLNPGPEAAPEAWFCRWCGTYYWDQDSAYDHVESEMG